MPILIRQTTGNETLPPAAFSKEEELELLLKGNPELVGSRPNLRLRSLIARWDLVMPGYSTSSS